MTAWHRLWIAWALLGLLTAAGIAVAVELDRTVPPEVWYWWVIPGLASGGLLELVALARRERDDTFSELFWILRDGEEEGVWSLSLATVAWIGWFVGTGDPWPSAGVIFLLWFLYHAIFEGRRT